MPHVSRHVPGRTPLRTEPSLNQISGWLILALAGWLGNVAGAAAQEAATSSSAAPPAKEEVTLETKDGVKLHATYYPGTKSRESVPVVCVHGLKGKRQEFDGMAKYMQGELGFAVIVPDLRGHGESADPAKKLEADSLTPQQFQNIVAQDLEAVKAFLLKQHNEGKLNIDKLCVVGSELGGTIGMLWTVVDWSWPPLLTGKVGQDVKAIALLSPEFGAKGLTVQPVAANPAVRSKVAMYVVMGADDGKVVSQAKRVAALFERYHNTTPGSPERDFFFDTTVATKLQGTQMLTEPSLHLNERIGQFFVQRAEQQNLPWAERKSN